MNICFFCSANDVHESYTKEAHSLASAIAREGHTLVWGGSDKGTMKVIADAAQEAGGKVIGVSVEYLRRHARKDADEMHVMPDLPSRKKKLIELSDVLVVLPGGLGTLDEVTEALELKKHAYHDKEIIFLNVNGFYDGFKMQLSRMEKENFLPRSVESFLRFADTADDADALINDHTSKGKRLP